MQPILSVTEAKLGTYRVSLRLGQQIVSWTVTANGCSCSEPNCEHRVAVTAYQRTVKSLVGVTDHVDE